ncbi:hypothetical protein BKA70DRAFT_1413257 [Coprinopsis sp. MPI-PUGE-AT-0042]|nr:hypothetical protein BKA70DRAFT_1413257 [Coprinopsis sp. MPI-PUGE-AT-0042]
MYSEAATLALELKKSSLEDASNEEVISKLISEHELQKSALEDERKRAALASRKLLDQAADMIMNLEARIKEQDEEIMSLREKSRIHSNGNEEPRTRIRARELKQSAQPGPPLAPTIQQLSSAELSFRRDFVVQKIAALNGTIFTAGQILGQTLVYQSTEESAEKNTQRPQAVIIDTRNTVVKVLGSYLTGVLETQSMNPQKGRPDTLLVLITLLIALTRWCAAAGRWWIPESKETEKLLYNAIRRAEDQAIARRSLTSAHLHISTDELAKDVMRVIICILEIAGWAAETPGDLSRFEERLPSVFEAICDVHKAMDEAANLEVFVVRCGDAYEPGLMEDTFEEDCAGKKERVAGPSGLGLRKVTLVNVPGVLRRTVEVMSLPSVILEKTVKMTIEPPPPPKPMKQQDNGGWGGGGRSTWMGY